MREDAICTCKGTGEVDSGASTSWGSWITVPCECTLERKVMTELVKEDGHAYVTSLYKKRRGSKTEKSKNIRARLKTRKLPEGVHPGSVRVGLSQTIPLRPYESIKVEVGVTFPALPEEMKDAYLEALEFCKKHLNENVTEILELRDNEA